VNCEVSTPPIIPVDLKSYVTNPGISKVTLATKTGFMVGVPMQSGKNWLAMHTGPVSLSTAGRTIVAEPEGTAVVARGTMDMAVS
jgi:hypothetical protein